MLFSGVELSCERALHAVVVRDDQAVGRHERRRAAAEPHDRGERLLERIGERVASSLHAHLLERVDVLRQRHLRRHPHAARIRVRRCGTRSRDPASSGRVATCSRLVAGVVRARAELAGGRGVLVAAAAGREQAAHRSAFLFMRATYHRISVDLGSTSADMHATAAPRDRCDTVARAPVPQSSNAKLAKKFCTSSFGHLLARLLAEVAHLEQLVGDLEQEPRRRARHDAAARHARARARQVELALRARDADVAEPALLADVGRVIGVGDVGRLRLQRARVRQQLLLEADHEAHRELEALRAVQRRQDRPSRRCPSSSSSLLSSDRWRRYSRERLDALAASSANRCERAEQALDVVDAALRRRHARRGRRAGRRRARCPRSCALRRRRDESLAASSSAGPLRRAATIVATNSRDRRRRARRGAVQPRCVRRARPTASRARPATRATSFSTVVAPMPRAG